LVLFSNKLGRINKYYNHINIMLGHWPSFSTDTDKENGA
jgi:hypothetical protein